MRLGPSRGMEGLGVLALEKETRDAEAGAPSADLGSEQQQEGLSGQHSSRERS